MPTTSSFQWTDLLPSLISAGALTTGAVLGTRATGKATELATAEAARAAELQVMTAEEQLELLRQIYNRDIALEWPRYTVGTKALKQLTTGMGIDVPESTFDVPEKPFELGPFRRPGSLGGGAGGAGTGDLSQAMLSASLDPDFKPGRGVASSVGKGAMTGAGIGGTVGGPIGAAVGAGAGAEIGLVASAFGRGRREANQIGPYQNALTDSIGQIEEALSQKVTSGQATDQDWQDAIGQVSTLKNQFYGLTNDFGRAGPGARQTIGSWVDPMLAQWGQKQLRPPEGRRYGGPVYAREGGGFTMPQQTYMVDEAGEELYDPNPSGPPYFKMGAPGGPDIFVPPTDGMVIPAGGFRMPETEPIPRRRGGPVRGQNKIHKVMGEFERGTLRSSSGKKVTSRAQAIAIAMSEAGMSRPIRRQAGGPVYNWETGAWSGQDAAPTVPAPATTSTLSPWQQYTLRPGGPQMTADPSTKYDPVTGTMSGEGGWSVATPLTGPQYSDMPKGSTPAYRADLGRPGSTTGAGILAENYPGFAKFKALPAPAALPAPVAKPEPLRGFTKPQLPQVTAYEKRLAPNRMEPLTGRSDEQLAADKEFFALQTPEEQARIIKESEDAWYAAHPEQARPAAGPGTPAPSGREPTAGEQEIYKYGWRTNEQGQWVHPETGARGHWTANGKFVNDTANKTFDPATGRLSANAPTFGELMEPFPEPPFSFDPSKHGYQGFQKPFQFDPVAQGYQPLNKQFSFDPGMSGFKPFNEPFAYDAEAGGFQRPSERFSFTEEDLANDPQYQTFVNEGMKQIERRQAARGMLQSGATLKAATRFMQNEALPQAYARRRGEFGLGRAQEQENYRRVSNEYGLSEDQSARAYNRAVGEFERNTGQTKDAYIRAMGEFGLDYQQATDAYNRALDEYIRRYAMFEATQKKRFDRLSLIAGAGGGG